MSDINSVKSSDCNCGICEKCTQDCNFENCENCENCNICGKTGGNCACNKYVTGGGVAKVIGSIVAGVMFYPIIIICIIMIIIAMFFIMVGDYTKGIILASLGAGSIAGIMFFIVKV